MLEKGQVWTGNVLDCFSRPFAWLMKCNRTSLFWKTWQRCLVEGWIGYSQPWPTSGLMRNGVCYQLPDLVCSTDEDAYSLLPTLVASESRDRSRAEVLASMDNGGRVARRICSRSMTLRSSREIVGLNPCFGELMMGFTDGWTEFDASETQ